MFVLKNPTVSYIVPLYNTWQYLDECIESIFDQDYSNIEVVVVDDGSEAINSSRVIADYKANKSDKRLVFIELGVHKGVGAATNVGFARATGDYLCFFASDDVILSRSKTSKQVKIMETTGADISYFVDIYHGETPSKAKLVKPKFTPHCIPGFYFLNYIIPRNNWLLYHALMLKEPIHSGALMIRRGAYEKYGSWSESLLTLDYDFLLRYARLGAKFEPIPGAPIFYRDHPAQWSKKHDIMRRDAIESRRINR